MANHALLSASSSHRWMACPPSARATEHIQDESSAFAKQGTDAHALCEYKIKHALGRACKDPTPDLDYYDAEMERCAEDYCTFVLEQLQASKALCQDPQLMVEERLDYSRWVPEGFGTGDAVLVADRELHIIDFKYGLGVLVEADGNPQMRCYALGALDVYDGIYDVDTVKMTIFQPRRANISTATMSKEDLFQWADEVLRPIARTAYDGQGDYNAGEHCKFCKLKATCRKRAEQNLKLAQYDFQPPNTIEPLEIASILPLVDDLIAWGSDIKEYALKQALQGTHYDGFKVVEGRANRRYSDEGAVIALVQKAGYSPYEEKLLGITAMTQLLGKKKFEELLGDFVEKPQGKPVLVPESDKRKEMQLAIDDFK